MAEPYASTTHRPERKPWQGIRARLIFVLLIPTIAAMVFGGLSISRALSAQAEARHAETVAQALPDTYNLAINILFERDGALAGVPEVVMRPLQQTTDESIEAWSAKAKEIDAGDDKDLENSIVEIQQALNGIDDLRAQIQEKDTQVEAQLAYTTVMNNLFGISAQMPTLENDEVFSKIAAISNVRPASEAMGTERVIMMKALSTKAAKEKAGVVNPDVLTDEEFAELARAEAKWRLSTADYYAKTSPEIRKVLSAKSILYLQKQINTIEAAPLTINYVARLVRATRPSDISSPKFVKDLVSWGAGPRAVQYLLLGGKARALLHGRSYVSTEDISALAAPVMRHRIVTNFSAESEGISADKVIQRLVQETPSKEGELTRDPRFQKIFAA